MSYRRTLPPACLGLACSIEGRGAVVQQGNSDRKLRDRKKFVPIRLPALGFFLFMLIGACHAVAAEVVVGISQLGEAFVVDVAVDAPVALKTAWEVMIDFGHMTTILNNLTSSKVVSREGNTLIVKQEGVAKYGLFSYAFQSEREIRLEPMNRILAKNRSGTAKRMESEARFIPSGQGVRINYHAEIVPDSALARMFGASFVHHEIEEQFQLMLSEMKRREKNQKPGISPEAGF